ncbi:hypothetical protein Acsp05_21550 [Actinokineospora sp. NBRC 105648]|nr:hypothetical protein Acsp05_21550 [Actinokineospora sp. NBRC 105648]
MLLPVIVVVGLVGAVGLLARVAPSRAVGLSQVVVDGADGFLLPPESLSCQEKRATAVCVADVDGRSLRVEAALELSGGASTKECWISFEGRESPCYVKTPLLAVADSVEIPGPLITDPVAVAALRDAVPWWREGDGWARWGAVLLALLGIGAGYGSLRLPVPAVRGRMGWALGAGAVALGAFVLMGALLLRSHTEIWTLALLPPMPVVAVGVGWWQWLTLSPKVGRRWVFVAGALAGIYAIVAVCLSLLLGGYVL